MKRIFFIAAIVLTLLFLFLLYIFISSRRRAPEETVREIPFPTKSQTVPTGIPPLIIEEEPLIEQIIARLPVSEPEYDIEYSSSSNTFVITIKESPFEQNLEKARQWFLQNGFSNTSGLNIIYNSYEWVE